ncbi:MAG: STAS-like domain-containing protein [Burkholderiales bacterium]|nr:STAS-like domain-containing protein [Burkholderiales bacterium]
MKNTKEISVAKDFSETPAGRYYTDGPYSGQRFREEILFPALTNYDYVIVDLDGTLGYGSSFLEETFGGLIREHKCSLDELNKKLKINSSRRLYYERAHIYMQDAENESK